MAYYSTLPFATVLVCAFAACTPNTDFKGKSVKKARTPKVETAPALPAAVTKISMSSSRAIESKTIHRIWTVTTDGVVTRLTVEGDEVKQKQNWSGISGGGGTRTYVTEGGFVAARFPYIYFIDPDGTPEGAVPEANRKDIGANNRICMASYLKGDKRYLIAVWGQGNFVEFPLAAEKPYKPLWDTPSASGVVPGVSWGYSCYIDQKRKIFYSQMGMVGALDLQTMTGVNPATSAPNGKFESTSVATVVSGPRASASYSMAGDNEGNVFNGASVYTMSQDTESDSVWVNAGRLGVFPRECLISNPTCTGYAWYDHPSGLSSGPISALRDGRIVAVSRGTGNVFLLSLKDQKDRTAGINAVKIASLNADPYMYTDFTGATLYVGGSEETYKLSEIAGFVADKPLVNTAFIWFAKPSSTTADWKNIKVESRCYVAGAAKPEYEVTSMVGAADIQNPLSVKSCMGQTVDHLDLKLTQLNGESDLAGVDRIQIAIEQ